MGFSDFILAILILIAIACGCWIFDINPFTQKIQIYNQQCTEMILDNTYCKGSWVDQPTITYETNKADKTVIKMDPQIPSTVVTYKDCSITDRKNWTCIITETEQVITISDGMINFENLGLNDARQISRLEFLQDKFLKYFN